jgi:DNA-damage-inducible protein J
MQHIIFMKTAVIHSRIQPEIKEQAEGILQRLGLSPTEAIRMFYTQITLRNGLPFDVAIPNDVTIKALEESRDGRNLERFDSTEKLFENWDAWKQYFRPANLKRISRGLRNKTKI